MLMLYAKITPPLMGNSPFRVTEVTQWEAEARAWSLQIPLDPQRKDILMLYFPECRHQDALDFIAWVHHRPILMDVMIALEEDRIFWKMWSVENSFLSLRTPINGDDEKFLKSLRVKWENNEQVDRTETQNQSGLHLVRPEDSSKQDPSSGSVR